MEKFITVVFKVNDMEKFRPELDKLTKKMNSVDDPDWTVTAMSNDNEIYRLELIEAALEMDNPVAACNKIIGTIDIHKKMISDFGEF